MGFITRESSGFLMMPMSFEEWMVRKANWKMRRVTTTELAIKPELEF